MARIFITGSSDGLGKMAAELLLNKGHQVVLHARNEQRAEDARKAHPSAETVLTADLSSIAQTIELVPASIAKAIAAYRTCNGRKDSGTVIRPMQIQNCTTYCLHSLLQANGRMCIQML